jgi:hypothetical protein
MPITPCARIDWDLTKAWSGQGGAGLQLNLQLRSYRNLQQITIDFGEHSVVSAEAFDQSPPSTPSEAT